jgi:hypothetical protein
VGNVAAAATDSGNPVKIGGPFISGTITAVTTGQRVDAKFDSYGNIRARGVGLQVTGADAFPNTLLGWGQSATSGTDGQLLTAFGGYGFNGTDWDRVRTVANGANTAGTGVVAAGLMAQGDDASIQAITENSFGNLRQSLDNHLLLASTASVVPYSPILHTQAVQIRGASGNVAAANAVATLTGTATTTVYISGFVCTPGGATSAVLVDIAVTGDTRRHLDLHGGRSRRGDHHGHADCRHLHPALPRLCGEHSDRRHNAVARHRQRSRRMCGDRVLYVAGGQATPKPDRRRYTQLKVVTTRSTGFGPAGVVAPACAFLRNCWQ